MFVGGLLAKIVGMALDRKSEVNENIDKSISLSPNADDENDSDFHETLPKDVLKIKDITITDKSEQTSKWPVVNLKSFEENKLKSLINKIKVSAIKENETSESKTDTANQKPENNVTGDKLVQEDKHKESDKNNEDRKCSKKQPSDSSTQSKHSDSIGSVIPVITISATESDEEILQSRKPSKSSTDDKTIKEQTQPEAEQHKVTKTSSSDIKSLRRQSSVDSVKEQKLSKERKNEQGHKYQYSL